MLHRLYISLLFTVITGFLHAQTNMPSNHITEIKNSDYYVLPKLDNQKLKAHYNSKKETRNRFAEARDVFVTPSSTGIWESTKNGLLVWRQAIKSPGARSINLGFTKFKLVGSAQLFIYNSGKSEILGPFSHLDNDDHMQLWTPIVSGDEIIIELKVNPEDKNLQELELSRVNHDFRGFDQKSVSGSCHLDVACGGADGWEEVDGYRDIIRSVGAYSIGGQDACSGVLINNTRQDCRPYFLTAEHCEVSSSDAPTVTVYWNFENSTCRQPNSPESGGVGNGIRSQFNSGASLRAKFAKSDFALLELDDPVNPEYDPFFAGWSRAEEPASMGVCIHHPGLEEKRISFDFNPLSLDETGFDTSFILVNDWDIGSTEIGSSGSPLFDENKRIIGQLESGLAGCGNDLFDVYGWFKRSWEGGGTPGTSLKSWLDPDNLGVEFLDGKDCGFFISTEETTLNLCSGLEEILIPLSVNGLEQNVTYNIENAPSGFDYNFDFENGNSADENNLTITNISTLGTGERSFDVVVTDGFNTTRETYSLNIFENTLPIPILIAPTNGIENLSTRVEFEFESNNYLTNIVQLSTDEQFSTVIRNETVKSVDIEFDNLEEASQYFWRVKMLNPCGESEWSEVFSFNTAKVFCTKIYSDDNPVIIEEFLGARASKSISFPYAVSVEDINVSNMEGKHTYIEDLSASLFYNGKRAVLFDTECGINEDFDLGFNDESTLGFIDCPPINQKLYRPISPLEIFDGEFAGGLWQLELIDQAEQDGGTFNTWEMQVCFSDPKLSLIVPADHKPIFCEELPLSISTYIYSDETNDWRVLVFDTQDQLISTSMIRDPKDPNAVDILFTNASDLEPGRILRLELIDNATNQKLAQSIVEIQGFLPAVATPEITSHGDGDLLMTLLDFVSWTGEKAESVILEIASDFNMQNIVYAQTEEFDNGNLPNIGFSGDGTYYMRVTQLFDCGKISTAIIQFDMDLSTDVNEVSVDWDVNIYPNPTRSNLTIQSSQLDTEKLDIFLFDMHGKRIQVDMRVESSSMVNLNTQGLESGMYFIIVQSKGKRIQKKFVKTR